MLLFKVPLKSLLFFATFCLYTICCILNYNFSFCVTLLFRCNCSPVATFLGKKMKKISASAPSFIHYLARLTFFLLDFEIKKIKQNKNIKNSGAYVKLSFILNGQLRNYYYETKLEWKFYTTKCKRIYDNYIKFWVTRAALSKNTVERLFAKDQRVKKWRETWMNKGGVKSFKATYT